MTGIPLIIAFFIMVVVMIVAISKFKIHPFLSIMGVSLILALLALPLAKVPGTIGAGFSGTFSSLGIVIILGAMIGFFLEKTGAALTMADWVIRRVGDKHPELAILLMGWIVSIPVFCDSGYVILNPIRKAIVKKTGVSAVAMAVALSAGLYTSHVFIPPTPGPIAAAQSLGLESHMLMVILVGFLVSIPSLAAGYFYARYIGKKVHAADEDSNETTKSYDELKAEFGRLPGAGISFAPIVMPIILMAVKSIVDMAKWTGLFAQILQFLGTPMIALTVGLIISVATLFSAGKGKEFYALADETLRTVGPILFVTAAGGVLGKVISEAGIVTYITEHASFLSNVGIFFPFIIAAILKTAGLVHRGHHDNGGHSGSVLGGRLPDERAGADLSVRRRADRHGHRRGRDDRFPRQRFLFLGRHQLRRHEGRGRLQDPDDVHPADGSRQHRVHLDHLAVLPLKNASICNLRRDGMLSIPPFHPAFIPK